MFWQIPSRASVSSWWILHCPWYTSANIVRMLREAGATEVHMRVSSPPFINPCYFGTDIPDEKDLIATGHTVEEINELGRF